VELDCRADKSVGFVMPIVKQRAVKLVLAICWLFVFVELSLRQRDAI